MEKELRSLSRFSEQLRSRGIGCNCSYLYVVYISRDVRIALHKDASTYLSCAYIYSIL